VVAVPSLGRASEVEAPPLEAETTAAGDLYARYSARIYGYCLNRLRSREEAEDATQTTFLNAFRGLRRGVTPEVEQAWLYKIAENVCLTRVRSNVRRMRVEAPTDLEPLHELVAAPARSGEELRGLEDALARLPEQQRRAILLREWQGLSYTEIAQALGTSQSAVETLIFRARRSLARALERPDERRGLRRTANLGSLVAWVKSIAFGGSTAVKVAAAIAAGSAVVAAGVHAPTRHAPPRNRNAPAAAAASAPVAVTPEKHTARGWPIALTRATLHAVLHRRPHRAGPVLERRAGRASGSPWHGSTEPAEPTTSRTADPPTDKPASAEPAERRRAITPETTPAPVEQAPESDQEEDDSSAVPAPKKNAPEERDGAKEKKTEESEGPGAPLAEEKPKKR
jgi:RNA polymerase sigma factor (sigma-70 family)